MKPNKLATKRTKARFKEHAPFLIICENTCEIFGNKVCLLLSSTKTNWLGWIPKEEIELKDEIRK